eukprot:2479601-Ditylum_brightwellii.AAC.1
MEVLLIQCKHMTKDEEKGVYHINTKVSIRKKGAQNILYYLPVYMTLAVNTYIAEGVVHANVRKFKYRSVT